MPPTEPEAPRPNFFIVGAPRCGTTAMYDYLRQHPQIYMPHRKEPVFFGADLVKRRPYLDQAGYLELFAPGTGRRRLGEATVWYLYSATAAAEIKAFAPDARIIIMLRDPVDMIASLHGHMLFAGHEDLVDLEDALAAEEDRLAGRRLPPGNRRPEGLRYRYCARYAPHVRRWLETFGRGQVLVILFDDLVSQPELVFRGVLEFLTVDSGFRPSFEVVNRNKVVRSRLLQRFSRSDLFRAASGHLPERLRHRLGRLMWRANIKNQQRPAVPAALRAQLRAELRDDVEELSRLISRDLSAWTAASPHTAEVSR